MDDQLEQQATTIGREIARAVATELRAAGIGDVGGPTLLARRSRMTSTAWTIGLVLVAIVATAAIVPNRGSSGPSSTSASAGAVLPDVAGGAVAGSGGEPSSAGGVITPVLPGPGAAGPTASAPSSGSSVGGAATASSPAPSGPRTSEGPGVTDTEITLGVLGGDYSNLGTLCPRCSNGANKDGLAWTALLGAWKRDGLLPVHGRDIKMVYRKQDALQPEQGRAACVDFAQSVKPFIALVGPSLQDANECLAKEKGIPSITGIAGYPEDFIASTRGNLYVVGPTPERVNRNFAWWMHTRGMLKGEVIGIYSQNDAATQRLLDRNLRPLLKQLGYTVKIDFLRDGEQSDGIAVTRFRAEGVTTALILSTALNGHLGFQKAAQGQGYKPKYPTYNAAVTYTDALADILYDPDQMDGNYGLEPMFWRWSARRPATPMGNPTATYCLKAYTDFTKRTLDVYDNDAELRNVFDACATLEVARRALELAGPNLSRPAFLQAINRVSGLETSEYPSVSFRPGKLGGGDVFTTVQFKKQRWQPENNLFHAIEGYRPFFVS